MNNWIEVSEENLAANYRALQAVAGEATEVLAVVKANGYGHGAARCAVALAGAGARWLGVTCAAEGAQVRQALGDAPVEILLMCGFFAPDVGLLREGGLIPVVWTVEQAGWLTGQALPVHLEIDTGMSRQGVRPGAELAALLDAIAEAKLRIDGVLTHFSSSEEPESRQTWRQRQRFEQAVGQVHAGGWRPRWIHAGASSAVDHPGENPAWLSGLAASAGARAMVRVGIALYGYALPLDGKAAPVLRPALRPVMTWKARILSTRDLEPGDTVGYNATFTASSRMRIALLPVGFADGLRRELSSTNRKPGGWVMVRGQRAPILGRISMNLTVVDITGIPEAAAGDEAIVLGPGVTADDHAALARTTAYEILCGVHPCG